MLRSDAYYRTHHFELPFYGFEKCINAKSKKNGKTSGESRFFWEKRGGHVAGWCFFFLTHLKNTKSNLDIFPK